MELNIFLDKTKEEKIDIYIHEKRKIVDDIEKLISSENSINGIKNGEIYPLSFSDIVIFTVDGEKIKAFTETEEFTVKGRLYMIEERMPHYFVKLNQSAVGNIRKIKKFDCSVSGTLKVTFNNGLTDFVSRRQVKAVRERLGL